MILNGQLKLVYDFVRSNLTKREHDWKSALACKTSAEGRNAQSFFRFRVTPEDLVGLHVSF